MEMSFDLPLEEFSVTEEIQEENPPIVSESTLVPKVGLYLALDISLQSSGICYYENGVKHVSNYKVDIDEESEFREVLARRDLKSHIADLVGGKCCDLIIIEDAYQGLNPDTTRKLYALNTAIDELILDGVLGCKKFLRVANGTWKHWLYRIDGEGRFKGLNDKARVEACLKLLGVEEDGKGYQDRLDSCGMLLGYFLTGHKGPVKKSKSFHFSINDICCSYQEDEDLVLDDVRRERQVDDLKIGRLHLGTKKLTKAIIRNEIASNPELVNITSDMVRVGYLLKEFGLEPTNSGIGYFAFWLNRSKYNKLRL